MVARIGAKAFCVVAPEDEGARAIGQTAHDVGCQRCPAKFRMGTGIALWHGQGRVQQEDTLIGPIAQITIHAECPQIILKLGKDVLQRPW